MASFQRMRERLPVLYRPDDDDVAGQVLPLAAADILTINGKRPAAAQATAGGGSVILTPAAAAAGPGPVPISLITLAAGRAPGSGYTLAFYQLTGDRPGTLPAAFASVQDGVAIPNSYFQAERFLVQLRRGSLGVLWLRAIGQIIEALNRQATQVLQAHWFAYADSALFDPYFLRSRQQTPGKPFPPRPDEPDVETFPYIHDLARLAALLPVLPWQDSPAQSEPVEEYRDRISRVVSVYKDGLGTLAALRGIVAAELPRDMTQPAAVRERSFAVEENTPVSGQGLLARQPGAPSDMVGPLMRWRVDNDGLRPIPPTVYVQGVAAQPGITDATRAPLIELYQATPASHTAVVDARVVHVIGRTRPVRLGIAYAGTLEAGQTLRLRPAYLSWLAREDGLQRSQPAQPGASAGADPTAPGPWQAEAGGPAGTARAILQTTDKALWVAAEKDGAGALWRYDGTTWTTVVDGLPVVNCLAEDTTTATLIAGTERGLLRLGLYPDEGQPFATDPAPADLAGPEILALLQGRSGGWWAGTADGAARIDSEGKLVATALRGIPVHAIAADALGAFYFGASLGLLQFQPGAGSWYIFAGGGSNEQAGDWLPLQPGEDGTLALPAEDKLFLPGVLAVTRTADSTLWIGTEHGLARYVAYAAAGLDYATRLEAFPDLGDTPVFCVSEDERGQVWFGGGRGLWRYDGRDLWQLQGADWQLLGQAALFDTGQPEPAGRGYWRFQRAGGVWQRFAGRNWPAFAGAPRTAAEPAVHAIAWTDAVVADLGGWDGVTFSKSSDVPATDLSVRYKPDETRNLAGGLPAVPRLPTGAATWRYLALEAGGPQLPKARPAWSCEGRLLPPPADLAAPHPGRYGEFTGSGPADGYDQAVYAYLPAARVWFTWEPAAPLSITVRLHSDAGAGIDPGVLDRVWEAIQRVRPAGVRATLAVEGEFVRGKDHA